MTMLDGLVESRQVLTGSVAGFVRKLAGTSSYDGLKEMISKTYDAIEAGHPQPISLDEIDTTMALADQLAAGANS